MCFLYLLNVYMGKTIRMSFNWKTLTANNQVKISLWLYKNSNHMGLSVPAPGLYVYDLYYVKHHLRTVLPIKVKLHVEPP